MNDLSLGSLSAMYDGKIKISVLKRKERMGYFKNMPKINGTVKGTCKVGNEKSTLREQ